MSDCKVVLSEQFRADILAIQDNFSVTLKKLKNTRDAEMQWRRWEEFQLFASSALDLEEGLADPSQLLRPFRDTTDASSTHLLKSASGRWTASFSLDLKTKTYYGIRVYQKPA